MAHDIRLSRRIRGRDVLLGETSALLSFAQVGHAHTLVDWFRWALWTVSEVHRELVRNRGRFAAAERIIRHLEDGERIADLSPAGLTWVARMAPYFRGRCDHGRVNVGELATARLAAELIVAGRRPIVLVDDRLGADLCRRFGAPVLATHDVVVDMVRAHALTRAEGARVWRGLKRSDQEYQRRITVRAS
ncbi:MAG TPA: hypothetical protein VIC57_06835 [Candidatus Dormibacteraeota bacterium]